MLRPPARHPRDMAVVQAMGEMPAVLGAGREAEEEPVEVVVEGQLAGLAEARQAVDVGVAAAAV